MKKSIFIFIFVFAAFLFVSCGGALTEMSGTWKKPGFAGKKYSKILVVAITNEIVKRNSVESAVVKELAKAKIKSTGSTQILDLSKLERNKDGKIDTTKIDQVKKAIVEAGYDGALVVSLLDKKEKTEYVPGHTYYQPSYYGLYSPYSYHGFYNYYYTTYSVVSTPGYYEERTNYYIESRLFDLAANDMVWASQSETLNPSNLSDFSASYSQALVNTLVNDRVTR